MFCWLAQANGSLICLGQPKPVQPLVNVILVSGSSIRVTLDGVAIFTHLKEVSSSRAVLRSVYHSKTNRNLIVP